MACRFQPIHVLGKKHVAPDTMSRRSDSPVYQDTFKPPEWVASPSINAIYKDLEDLYTSKVVALVTKVAHKEEDCVLTWEKLA